MKRNRIFALAATMVLLLSLFCACTKTVPSPLEKRFNYDLSPYLTLPETSDIPLDDIAIEVTDADIQTQVLLMRSRYSKLTAAGRPAEAMDYVVLTYEGYIDGKRVEAFCESDVSTVVGCGAFLPEIEAALFGAVEKGNLSVRATLPDPYLASPDYSGKTVQFLILVKEVDTQVFPDYTDEWVATLGDYKTTAEFEAAIRKVLIERKETQKDSYLCEKAWAAVMDGTVIKEYPKEALEEEYQDASDYYKGLASYQNMTLEILRESIGLADDDAYEAYLQTMAKDTLKDKLVLTALARKYQVSVSEEEYLEGEQFLADSLEVNGIEALEALYDADSIYEAILSRLCQRAIVKACLEGK